MWGSGCWEESQKYLEASDPHAHTSSASGQPSHPEAHALFHPPLCPQEALQRLVNLYGLLHGLQVSGAGLAWRGAEPSLPAASGGAEASGWVLMQPRVPLPP